MSNAMTLSQIIARAETLGRAEGKGSKSRGTAIETVILGATTGAMGALDGAGKCNADKFWTKFQQARALERGETYLPGKDHAVRVSNIKTAIAASELIRAHDTNMVDQVATMKEVVKDGDWSKKEFEAIYRLVAAVKKAKRPLSRSEMGELYAPKQDPEGDPKPKSEVEMLGAAIKAVEATLNGAQAAPANGHVARPGYDRPETQHALQALKAARMAAEMEAKQQELAAMRLSAGM